MKKSFKKGEKKNLFILIYKRMSLHFHKMVVI